MGYRTTKSKTKVESNKASNNYTDFFYYAFRNILIISIPLVIFSAIVLSSLHSSAESNASGDVTKVDNISLTINVSCTLSATELTPHNITLEGNGLHRENIGTTKVGVFCNDNNGYNIYAVGHSNNTDGNTDLIVNGLSSDYNIKTGIYSSGSTISSWGMKLTAGTGTGSESERTPPTINNGYNNYNVIPNVYTMVASRPSGTNMDKDANPDITGSYFTTTYDIYASSVQPAGTYNGKVKYILTHPNTNAPNTINDIDAAFAVNGKQKSHLGTDGNYHYAMQDMTTDICNSVARTGEATTTQLVDIRDNKLYYVTKLKDGHCWMTQNLDLDIGGTGVAALTSENTDISTTASGIWIYADGYTKNGDVWTWNPTSAAITSNAVIDYDNNTVSNWAGSVYGPGSAEGSDIYFYTSDTTADDVKYTSFDSCSEYHSGCEHYHVGNYYNWAAAVASNNASGYSAKSNADNSICPKGWRLPVIASFGELLATQGITSSASSSSYAGEGFNRIRQAPIWLVRSGSISGSTLNNPMISGGYLSSTIRDSNTIFQFSFSKNGTSSGYILSAPGLSVRCMAR